MQRRSQATEIKGREPDRRWPAALYAAVQMVILCHGRR
jgi:hypothetical protein